MKTDTRENIFRKGSKKFSKPCSQDPYLNQTKGNINFSCFKVVAGLILFLVFLFEADQNTRVGFTSEHFLNYDQFLTASHHRVQHLPGHQQLWGVQSVQEHQMLHILGKKETGNFLARYLYGNKSKGIINLHLNIRSLSNKVGEIKNIIQEQKPHIFGVSECELKKINNFYDESKLKVPGYKLFLPKSWNDHGNARVAIYVKKTLEVEQVSDLEDNRVQSIWIKGGFKGGRKIYYCHCYREHGNYLGRSMRAQRTNLDLLLNQWEKATEHGSPAEPNEIHISGDMNLDSLRGRWLEPGYHLISLAKMVVNTCNAHNLTQLVMEATRSQYNRVENSTSMSCIDHVYTNARYRCSSIKVTSCGSSDHDLVGYTRFSKEPKAPSRTIRKRSYKEFKEQNFLRDLAMVDWSDVLGCVDVDMATAMLTRKLTDVLNTNAPWIVFQHRKFYSPWLTKETKEMMSKRDKLKKKAKDLAELDLNEGREASEEQVKAWAEFKKVRNEVTNMKRKDEAQFKSSKISESISCPQATWRTAKCFMGWKTVGSPSQLEIGGQLVTKASRIASIMNRFFVDKVNTIRDALKNVAPDLSHCYNIMRRKRCSLQFRPVSIEVVRKLLKNLKNSKCTSIDELDNFAVKLSADYIAQPLHHIVTLSLMQNTFPSSWKQSKLIPLHKKHSQLNPKNYRPVAILSPLSKILEKVIYQQIYDYFNGNKLFHENLHGYRRNRSTQTALIQMYDRWVRAAHEEQLSGVILLDLSAAFDLVDSSILLKKLQIYGFDDSSINWVHSYLSERNQAVWIDHVFSDPISHSIGVPQGSNLGPLFFLVFFNDLLFSLTCRIDAYADDSTMSTTGPAVGNIGETLSENCENVINWMYKNKLKLNADKTHLLTVGTTQRLNSLSRPLRVTMDGFDLEENEEKCELLLGCKVQSDLKWRSHIEGLLKKLKLRLAGLSCIRNIAPFNIRNVITSGIFNSVLVYCLPLFGGCNVEHINDLQVMQNRAAQIVTHFPPRTNRNLMYDKLKWLTVPQLIFYHTMIAVYKVRQSKEPEYLASFLLRENRMGNIIIPTTKLSLAKRSFVWRGSEGWNSLPQDIRKLRKLGAFKKNVKQWICSNIPRFPE